MQPYAANITDAPITSNTPPLQHGSSPRISDNGSQAGSGIEPVSPSLAHDQSYVNSNDSNVQFNRPSEIIDNSSQAGPGTEPVSASPASGQGCADSNNPDTSSAQATTNVNTIQAGTRGSQAVVNSRSTGSSTLHPARSNELQMGTGEGFPRGLPRKPNFSLPLGSNI